MAISARDQVSSKSLAIWSAADYHRCSYASTIRITDDQRTTGCRAARAARRPVGAIPREAGIVALPAAGAWVRPGDRRTPTAVSRRFSGRAGRRPPRGAGVQAFVCAVARGPGRYTTAAAGVEAALERLLRRLERFAGLASTAGAAGQTSQRLGRILALLLERAVADRASGEAWYAMRHMEPADFGLYLLSDPPAGDAPLHAVVEYARNLRDFANKLAVVR